MSGPSGWGGNLARTWDACYRETTAILDEWVSDAPSTAKTAAAAGIQSMLDLGAMLVDVLKLGEGAAQGGSGWIDDAFRLLQVSPALGKIKSIHTALRALKIRPSGNLGLLMEEHGVLSELRRLFYDNVGKWARGRYWGIGKRMLGEGADGRHLHHWLFANRFAKVPNGLRQAGFNLMELPASWNQGLGAGSWRTAKEFAFALGVLVTMIAESWAAGAHANKITDDHRKSPSEGVEE